MNTEFNVIIPAIFDTDDFANKAMADIHGKPMIQHVFESAKNSGACEIVIVTDNARVGMTAEDFGATVCMIIDEDLKGIDRLAEVVDRMEWSDDTIVVSLPGDAPLTPGAIISQVAEHLSMQADASSAALYSIVAHDVAAKDSTVICVTDISNYIMYLSRRPIPHQSEDTILSADYKCNIDINAYRAWALRAYLKLPPGDLEQAEGIDELKLLYNGFKIYAAEANSLIGHRVIVEDDIEKVKIQIAPRH